MPPLMKLRQQLTLKHDKYLDGLKVLSAHCRSETVENMHRVPAEMGIVAPASSSDDTTVDMGEVEFLSELATASKSSLPDLVRLVRGQTETDPRPNKDLYALPRPPSPHLHHVWRQWNEVVNLGVVPEWFPERPAKQ